MCGPAKNTHLCFPRFGCSYFEVSLNELKIIGAQISVQRTSSRGPEPKAGLTFASTGCRFFELPHSKLGLESDPTVLLPLVTRWRITPIAQSKDRRISHTIHCYYLNSPAPCYCHSMGAVKPAPVESETQKALSSPWKIKSALPSP